MATKSRKLNPTLIWPIYHAIAQDTTTAMVEINGQRGRNLGEWSDTGDILGRIEEFVTAIATTKEPPFRVARDEHGMLSLGKFRQAHGTELPLGRYYRFMNGFTDAYFEIKGNEVCSRFEFSEYVNVFFRACNELDLHYETFRAAFFAVVPTDKTGAELFNELVEGIRNALCQPSVRKRIQVRQQNAIRNFSSNVGYVEALFERVTPRLLVLRLDLSYRQEYAALVSLPEIKADLARFLNNRRHKPGLFEALVGYVWRIRYNELDHFHVDLMLLYDGYRISRDDHLTDAIGEYWNDTVSRSNAGTFDTCRNGLRHYQYFGTGMIDQADEKKRRLVIDDVLHYWSFANLFKAMKDVGHYKITGRGEMPRINRRSLSAEMPTRRFGRT